MKKYITKQSSIKGAGKGLFTNAFFKKGEVIGLAHVNGQPTKEVGSNHNHNEKNPTANNIKNGNKRYLIASKNLKPGEEITTNYRLQPELEQPEDFKKKKSETMTPQKDGYRTYSPFKNLPYIDVGSDTIDSNNIVYDLKLKANNGLTKFIKKNTGLHTLPGAKVIREIPIKRKGGAVLKMPNKKNSKGYSRSLSATNKLFTQNFLFAKPKSRKNKVYNPNAKYYAEGGESESGMLVPPVGVNPNSTISAAPTFNDAFKVARSKYGPNHIFEYKGRKYGTNLVGEDFKPTEEVLASAGLNTPSVKDNLNKQNSDLNDPYASKSTVKLEPDAYKDWNELKQKNLELNASANADKIINYKNNIGGDKNYIIVDKKKGLMHVYQPGNNKPLFTSPVDLGASIGDAQTVTKIKDKNGDGKIDSKEAQVGAADFDMGNKSTGAGKYFISNIDPKGYGGLPLFNMMNESQYESFLKTGNVENVATSIHKGYIPDDNSRVSNGCIRCNKTTLNNLTKYLQNSSEVYVLPEDPNNQFIIENDKLNIKIKNKSPYYTYQNNGKVYKKENGAWYTTPKVGDKFIKISDIDRIKELNKNATNAGYNFYEDSKGNVQKGQGVNLGSTLNYVPIKTKLDKEKFINDKFTYFDFNNEQELGVVNKFVSSLEQNKQKAMKAAKINGDVYNDIAQIAFGIFGTESNFADTHSAIGNFARATAKYFDPKGSSSPDYQSKYNTYGADEKFRSVGLTQIRWNYLNDDEKKALKSVGINSNADFMEPAKAALGTTVILGIRYNQQLTDKQKKDIWTTLPKTWSTRDNYADRVLSNSKYLQLEQKVTNKNSATKKDKWGRPSTSKWYGFNPKTKKYEYQLGGITSQEEIDDANTTMMKARLAYANEFGNPAAKRMINLPDNPYQFDNGDTGSHYMASMDNYAVPQIQDENGVLQLGDYGPESNEAIRFDSDEDANYFAENYKDVSPGFLNEKQYGGTSNDYIEADLDEDEIEEYRRGGYIVEELNNYAPGGSTDWPPASKNKTYLTYSPFYGNSLTGQSSNMGYADNPFSDEKSDFFKVNTVRMPQSYIGISGGADPYGKFNHNQGIMKKLGYDAYVGLPYNYDPNNTDYYSNTPSVGGRIRYNNTIDNQWLGIPWNKVYVEAAGDYSQSDGLNANFSLGTRFDGKKGRSKGYFEPHMGVSGSWGPHNIKPGAYSAAALAEYQEIMDSNEIPDLEGDSVNMSDPMIQNLISAIYNENIENPLAKGKKQQGAMGDIDLGFKTGFEWQPKWLTKRLPGSKIFGDLRYSAQPMRGMWVSGMGENSQSSVGNYNGVQTSLSDQGETNKLSFSHQFTGGLGLKVPLGTVKDKINDIDFTRTRIPKVPKDCRCPDGTIVDRLEDGSCPCDDHNEECPPCPDGSVPQRLKDGTCPCKKIIEPDEYARHPRWLKNGGISNDYIELDLNPEEIQRYKDGGYIVEELPEMQSGGSPSQVWYQYTGTPWSEARKKGLTDGSEKQNTELRKRILAGEFGKLKFSNEKYQNVKSNYDKNVEKMVAQGKTLDQLVQQKVGTKAGLKSRFPELFKTKSKLDNFIPKNYNSSNSSSSKNKNTKSRWGNVTVKSNDGKPSYRKDDYIDMVQSKDSKTKAEGLAMQAEHKKQLETEKLKKQIENLKDSGFDPKTLLANAETQRVKTKDTPKVKVEPIPGSMASQFKGDPYKKYYDDKGKEIKPITLPVEEGFKIWDDNKGLLEQEWFPFSKQISKSIKQQDAEYIKNMEIAAKEKEEADFQYREAMIKENPEISIEEVDQFIQDQKDEEWLSRQPSAANNYNDGPIQMVYPEKYFIGPGKGIVGNLFRNPYVMGAGNLYFGAQGISEWADSNSDLRKSIGKAWDDPTWNNIGDFGYELGMNALYFSGLPFGKIGKIGKIPIRKYGPFKPRKPKTINLNQNPGWLQLPKVNSKGYFEYKKYQDGGNVSKTWEQKTDDYKLNKEIISDLSKEEINKLVSQGYIVEQIN